MMEPKNRPWKYVARTPYAVIRSAHILWMMAVIPLAVASMKEAWQDMSGFALAVLFFSGMVWIMMFMFFDMMCYPASTVGAAMATSAVFANGAFALHGSGGDWTYSAYMNFLAFLAAFAVAFVGIVGWGFQAGVRRLIHLVQGQSLRDAWARLVADTRQWGCMYLTLAVFFGGLAVSSVYFGVAFARPFGDRFLAIPSRIDRIGLGISFALQAIWNLVPFWRYSIFGPEAAARPDRDPELQPWFGLSVFALIISTVILLFVVADVSSAGGK